MGILQSVLQTLGIETEEEENGISSVSSYNWNSSEESPRQWQNGNRPTRSHQMKYVTVSVPVLKDSSSLAYTSVKKEAAFVKENAPPKACRGTRLRDEVPVVVKCRVEVRWIKHYSSCQRILLVGEGDFSFSTCLAAAFGWASNMVATSLDSKDGLITKYKNAEANLMKLRILGATVLHGVDATRMWNLPDLRCKKFHRIIYNFPHAGFLGMESDPAVMMMHRDLVRGFLHNASTMLTVDGEIHVNHKAKAPFDSWRIEDLGSECSLVCVAQDEFRIRDYPGYNNKRGSGSRADEPFPLGACKTYRFRLHPIVVDNLMTRKLDLIPPAPQMFITHGVGVQQQAPTQMFSTRRRDEVPVVVKCRVEGRWIKHYSSCQRILLVGEGDFSFSTCLAAAFGWASNMVATSLDSKDFLVKNYGGALSNLVELCIRKCTVIHGINATEMANHDCLGGMKFDRIIFNFPWAGFFKDLPRDTQLRLHRSLVSGFMENAKKMLSEDGEIHITHKTNGFHKEWKLEEVASFHRLRLVEAVDFNNVDYQGYNTKRGFGGDDNFNCNPSKTFKFRL